MTVFVNPVTFVKSILSDYDTPCTATIQWKCDHEADDIWSYTLKTQRSVHECGIFLSCSIPYLATTPDGVVSFNRKDCGVIKVKYPCKHRKSKIENTCSDTSFY